MIGFFTRLRRLSRERSGVAAVEFALICPLLIIFLFGTAEIVLLLIAQRKVTTASGALSDLLAQYYVPTRAELDDMFLAAQATMFPLDTANITQQITVYEINASGSEKRLWAEKHGTETMPSSHKLAAGLKIPNSYLVVGEAVYDYRSPVTTMFFNGAMMLEHVSYSRGRLNIEIKQPTP